MNAALPFPRPPAGLAGRGRFLRRSLPLLPLLAAVAVARAQAPAPASLPPPKFKVAPARKGQIRVEHVYHFTAMPYDPPHVVTPAPQRKDASHATPEDAVIAHFSAMYARDEAWFESTWAKESQQQMKARDAAENRPAGFWAETWGRVLKDRKVHLTARIESGDFVLIEYKLVSVPEAQTAFEDTVVVRKEGVRWVLTQELAADPVPAFWKTPGSKLEKIVR
jgi:hypothetical protein